MKKLFLFSIFISIYNQAIGQRSWALSLSGSLGVTSHIAKYPTQYVPIAGYSGSINIHRYFKPTIFLRTGLNFYESGVKEILTSQINPGAAPNLVSSGSSSNGIAHNANLYSWKYLECPLLLGWKSKTNSKVHFYGSIGPAFRMELFFNYIYNIGGQPSSTFSGPSGFNVGLNGILTGGISIDLNPKISLLIENQFRMHILEFSEWYFENLSTNNYSEIGYGIQLSFLYFLNGKK